MKCKSSNGRIRITRTNVYFAWNSMFIATMSIRYKKPYRMASAINNSIHKSHGPLVKLIKYENETQYIAVIHLLCCSICSYCICFAEIFRPIDEWIREKEREREKKIQKKPRCDGKSTKNRNICGNDIEWMKRMYVLMCEIVNVCVCLMYDNILFEL